MKSGVSFSRLVGFLGLMLANVLNSNAQTNISSYPFEMQFNSSGYNPAFLDSPNKFTFSIFPLGGTSIGYNNQQTIKELVSKVASGLTTDQDYKDVLQSLANKSSFHQSIESSLLSFTYKTVYGSFNFRINENENFMTRINGNVSTFIIKEGIQSTEVNQSQYLPAQAMHYREYSLAYSTPTYRHRFKAGIRAKMYFGKSSFFSDISGIIQNDAGNYFLRTSGKVNISAPEVKTTSNDGTSNSISLFTGSNVLDYMMNSNNRGFGFDLGFKYRLGPRLSFTMSMIDFGKISWKSNLNSKYMTGEYEIETPVVPSISETGVETITKTIDQGSISESISSIFNLAYDHSEFTTTMPLSVYSGLSYRLNPKVQLNLLNRFVSVPNMSYNTSSVTVSFDLNESLSVNAGYAIVGNSYNNIPLAVLFRKDFGQIFLGTDNLAAFLLPGLSDFAGFSFGTCFYIFKKRDVYKPVVESYPYYKPRKYSKNSKGLIKNVNWEL